MKLQVSGHIPRNYPTLSTRLLPGSTRMLFGSSQGISLIGLPGGETQAFWRLSGAENATFATLYLSPQGSALIVIANRSNDQNQGSLLYWLAPVK